jgi:GTP-binding protein
MRYAHQGGSNPPLIVVHGSALDKVPESYRRYLENVIRQHFGFQGVAVRLAFRSRKER